MVKETKQPTDQEIEEQVQKEMADKPSDNVKKSFKEFMNEQKIVNRWFVLVIALFGAFCGALLAVGFMVTIGLGWP